MRSCLDIFSLVYHFSFSFFLSGNSPINTEICLKGLFHPKQLINQLSVRDAQCTCIYQEFVYPEASILIFGKTETLIRLCVVSLCCSFMPLTLKAPNKNYSRRHIDFSLLSFEENKA